MHKDYTSVKGIRAIAVYEALKGIIVLFAGFGLLTLLHKNIPEFAEDAILGLHLDPESRYPQMFIENFSRLDDAKIKFIFFFAIVYALVRFVEAYGLWRLRGWAEWFAIISGSIYLPIEIYEIFQKPTVVRFLILLVNLLIVLYLLYVRRESHFQAKHETVQTAGEPLTETSSETGAKL